MENLSEATRPIMWNISQAGLMYLLMFAALAVFAYGLYKKIAYWRQGKPDSERLSEWGKRFWILVKELVSQRATRNSRFPGIFHSLIFYSFVALAVTTAVVALDYDIGTSFFKGYVYVVLSVAAELAGLLVLVGVAMAAWRRMVVKPKTLVNSFSDVWPLLLVSMIIVTGFLVEGLRIAGAGDTWAGLTPVGFLLSVPFSGMSAQALAGTHKALWWIHTVLALGWIAMIPYTKFVHLLSLPMNVFFSKLKPRGELQRVNIYELMESEDFDEENFSLGIEGSKDFTWKQRLDFDACISCGRCEEVCPARLSGHPFSPREFIARCHDLLAANAYARAGVADAPSEGAEATSAGQKTVVELFNDPDYIWYCRTCMACMEVCPACIDHVDTMVEVRRNEVMIQGRGPQDALIALKNLETRRNPFGSQSQRESWVREMRFRVVGRGEQCDVIYWIGCCTTFDTTKQKIATDLCRLLERCGITFGVIGADEKCCGDPARVLGDERLFQEIAEAQVEELNSRKFKILLASCPHCYNVLKNEYPQFGGNFNVLHHTEFMHEMIWSGDLLPKVGMVRRIVYHDPCYLGRYQRLFNAPREVLKALPGAELIEMSDHMERSLCCGGGGGHYWMDLKSNERINNLRVQQAKNANADTIVTACAYCKQMLDDSVKQLNLDEEMEVIDIASLLLSSLSKGKKKRPDEDEGREGPKWMSNASFS